MNGPGKDKDPRRQRLEQALRENLKRRKAQARERAQAERPKTGPAQDEADTEKS